MFRKNTKRLEQNLLIISKDSIKELFWKIHQNIISIIARKTLILGFQFSKFGCCKPTTLPNKIPRFF